MFVDIGFVNFNTHDNIFIVNNDNIYMQDDDVSLYMY
jgi:hypothetical protein